MIFAPIIDIAGISLILAVVSKAIQNKYMDKDAMKAQQEKMKEKQKKMKELMKKEDQKSKNELEALEKEMFEAMQEMMSKSSKVMLVSLVVFLPAFAIIGFLYGEAIINLPLAVPWLMQGFDLFNIGTWGIEFYEQTNWFGWYFLSYLVITLIINGITSVAKKAGAVNG